MGRPQTPSRGCIWAAETQRIQNTPPGGRLSPHRGVQFSSIPCCPIVALELHRFAQIAPNAQKWSKNKVPLFLTIFREVPGLLDHARNFFWKKVRFCPPAGHPPGEKTALFFFEIRHQHSPTNRELPKIVFFRGGPLNPPSGFAIVVSG